MQNGNSRDNGFAFHCLYDKREIRETMRKSEQKGEARRDRVERTSRRNECGPSMTSARNGSSISCCSSLRQSWMQIYDDLIYGAAELLQDRATFLSFLLRNSFHLPSTRILRCSEREEKKRRKKRLKRYYCRRLHSSYSRKGEGISDLLIKDSINGLS